jgi:hypothetical protein
MTHLKITRRSILRSTLSAAAATAVSPFFPISERRANAQGGLPKRLFLVFYNGGYAISQDWPVGTETNFTFPSLVDCFTPVKSQMIILKNMRRGMDGSHGSHQGGTGGLWTNQSTVTAQGPGPMMKGPSIDRMIMNKIKQPTTFQSLDLDVQLEEGNNLRSKTRFDMGGNPIQGEMDPSAAFDRIFTDGIVNVMTGGGPVDPKVAERMRAERKSVLDIINEDLTKLGSRMGGQDKARVDQHLEAVRSIEQRLSPGMGGANGLMFKAPVKSDYPKMDFLANDNYPKVGKLHMDLLVAGLASDRARIANLMWSQGNGCKRFTWAGVTGQHHSLTHGGVTTPQLDKINQYHFQQHAYLISAMMSVKEGNGTMLDNTVMAFGNELHDGNSHNPDPSMVFLAGSGGGYFKTGRYLEYGPVDKGVSGRSATPNHSQLLVSLCQYMGLDVNAVGDPAIGPGGTLARLR